MPWRFGAGEAMMNKDLIYVIEQIGTREGDRQGGSLRGAGVCPALGVEEDDGRGRQRADGDRPPHRHAPGLRPQEGGGPRSPIPSSRSVSRRAAELNGDARAGRRDRDGAGAPGVRAHRGADRQAGDPAAGARRRARRGLLRVHRQRGQDRPRHRPPHREAERGGGAGQGGGGHHRARAASRRAVQPGRPAARLHAGGQEDGQGPADPALAHASRLPGRGSSRPRSRRSRRGSCR